MQLAPESQVIAFADRVLSKWLGAWLRYEKNVTMQASRVRGFHRAEYARETVRVARGEG